MSNLPDPLFMQAMNALLWLLIIVTAIFFIERRVPKLQLTLIIVVGFLGGIFSEHFPLFF